MRSRPITIIPVAMVVILLLSGVASAEKFRAHTTVMANPVAGQVGPTQDELVQLARSRTVLERTAVTLQRLRAVTDPASVLKTLEVSPIKDTHIISIEVTSESESEAKATADVLARELGSYCEEVYSSRKPGVPSREPVIKIVDPARTMPIGRSGRMLIIPIALLAFCVLVGVGMAIGYALGRRSTSGRANSA